MPREKKRHVVLVDTREPKMVRLAIQAQLPDEIECVALPEGDFALPDSDSCLLGVERKTVGDFLASLGDGRLASQLTRMMTAYKIQVLVIEGSYTVSGEGYIETSIPTHWSHAAFQMTLWSLQRQFPDLVVLWSLNLGTTAGIIKALSGRGYKGCFDDTGLFSDAAALSQIGANGGDPHRRPVVHGSRLPVPRVDTGSPRVHVPQARPRRN